MSTLTKILIVLIALSSIFLCGITVTYVGSATNYKEKFDGRKKEINSLKEKEDYLTDQVNDLEEKNKSINDTLSSTVTKHLNEVAGMTTEINTLRDDLAVKQTQLDNIASVFADNQKTMDLNTQLAKKANEEKAKLQDQQTANIAKINQLQEQLVEQNAYIEQLQNEKKLLAAEKTELQNQLNSSLLSSGKRTGIPSASNMAPAIRDIDLEGVILQVKPEDSLVSISKGSAHGVSNNMRFHVVRNNEFICDVVISKVDADQASGILDLVTNKLPKAGDKVKTNF